MTNLFVEQRNRVAANISAMYSDSELRKANYNKQQLTELIAEHEKLIAVLESKSTADDKEELKNQKKELEKYKADLQNLK